MFHHNQGTGIVNMPLRGNTGAVAITYFPQCFPVEQCDSAKFSDSASITVNNSVFHNNSALAEESYQTSSDAILSGVLTGRAGGLGIFAALIKHNVSIIVSGCRFTENYARSFGGGLYFLFATNLSHFDGVVKNCSFISNTAVHGGGGFIVTVSTKFPTVTHTVEVVDSLFLNNRGDAGGGLYYITLLEQNKGFALTISRTEFTNNSAVNREEGFGAALAASMYAAYTKQDSLPVHTITNW